MHKTILFLLFSHSPCGILNASSGSYLAVIKRNDISSLIIQYPFIKIEGSFGSSKIPLDANYYLFSLAHAQATLLRKDSRIIRLKINR